jgi:PhnB protein
MKLTPFLLFDGNCAEAMHFYQRCLGGELHITKLGDTPMAAQQPIEQHGKVVNAYLSSGLMEFTAADWLHPTRARIHGNNVGLFVNGGTYEELRLVFDRLAAGAPEEFLDDLRPMPFGTYGHLIDAYGIQWFFQGDLPPDASGVGVGDRS